MSNRGNNPSSPWNTAGGRTEAGYDAEYQGIPGTAGYRDPGGQPPFDPGTAAGNVQGGDTLRDWQRQTWYGAVPQNMNPFDEPESAPEMLYDRSEDLMKRQGNFWGSEVENGEANGPEGREDGWNARWRPSRRRVVTILLAALATVAVLALVCYFGIFRVREIRVLGNSRYTDQEIIEMSGIGYGTPILAMDVDQVRMAVGSPLDLELLYLEKELPGTAILRVKEREACCWMTWCGIYYTMDRDGLIMGETEQRSEVQSDSLVRVDGLGIRSGCMTGQTLVLDSEEQELLFENLFLEMKVLACTDLIEEVDLSSLRSLLMTTRDGYTVALGDGSNIHAKLRSMLLTMDKLQSMGHYGGIINVTSPENPVYSPSKQTGV